MDVTVTQLCTDTAWLSSRPTPLVTYRFKNACDHEATMVTSKLRAVAVLPDGDYQELDVEPHHRYRYSYRVDPHQSDVAELFYRGGVLPETSEVSTPWSRST